MSATVPPDRPSLVAPPRVTDPADSAGTATGRLRPAILDATRRLMLAHGPAITLAQVADQAGLTLDAVRTEFDDIDQLRTALMISEIDGLVTAVGHRAMSEALAQAAMMLSEHPLLEALGGHAEPVLARMARVDVRLEGWQIAAQSVESILARSGRRGGPMVLRWLASYLTAPGSEADIRADVDILVTGLPPVVANGSTVRKTG